MQALQKRNWPSWATLDYVLEDEGKKLVIAGLDQIYWHLCQFLRIEEATPYIKRVLATSTVKNSGETNVIPLLYLGVALHKVPGEEAAAHAVFTAAFDHGVDAKSVNSTPGTKLHEPASTFHAGWGELGVAYQRAVRCRDWPRWHKFGTPQPKFMKLVTDPDHQGKNFIIDHPEMQNLFEGVTNIRGDLKIHFG